MGAGRDQKVLDPLELELQEVGWNWNPGSVEEQEALLTGVTCLSRPRLNFFMSERVCLGTYVYMETRRQPQAFLKTPSPPMVGSFNGPELTN